jgi:hypothetical protein|nr:MAG TPA: hypothetical protein [Caudoviricetes sp.]
MRINSYNKFFAKVAEIMNTSIKDVKQLGDRYKVELANHVYLNVYRGVDGSLFIHDHRGIAHVESCYDFEDFKTIKDLYDRLVSDYVESAKREVLEVKQELNSRFGKELQYFDTDSLQPNKIAKIENINHCPNQNTCCIVSPFVHCNYNYKSDSCIKAHKNFIHDCEQVHKQMKAKSNPEWHHVSLKTLANIDFDMLDEKRKVYLSFYKKWQEVRKNLRKCSCGNSYERCCNVFRRQLTIALDRKEISKALVKYFDRQVSMVNVECGIWCSMVEEAMGHHDSRKYNRTTLRY